ncbi:MAG: thioredoxin domain-containing protein [Desulfobacca sp.]|nr:thioredoxin domain-containing protein [Desulfobacca sp.]
MTNHLIHEKSPYLLQHAENPVHWYPWGQEAFQKAQGEDRPIFLSIGYATCHWCHVMAHESFEDEEVAQLLNQSYVAVKVDREERPDIDQVYMSVCQALTGRGGWPLSIFMTPEGKPFFAGTYFPKRSRLGMSGFMELLTKIADLWKKDREKIVQAGEDVTRSIQTRPDGPANGFSLTLPTLEYGQQQLAKTFDPAWGGFGASPKFPTPHHLTFLLRRFNRNEDLQVQQMTEKTLEAMRFGGIFDQVGLGFHRYSVDEKWLVPHFEKMLYDQALLAMAYTEAYQAFKSPFYGQVTREIFTYVLRELMSPEGGFYSAEDADSEGREGLFYLWTSEEVHQVLGQKAGDLFSRFYNITPHGNFEDGMSIPFISISLKEFAIQEKVDLPELEALFAEARERLFQVRNQRIHPLKDDKILTAWNGLMIAALAKGSQALGDSIYAQAAKKATDFVLNRMRTPAGGLYRRYRDGHIAYPGYLEDYAFFIWGLIELYETTFETRYIEEALRLNHLQIDLFWDREKGGCFFTPNDGEPLITREKDLYDGAIPSGNSVTALNCLRLGRLTGNTDWEEKADHLFRNFSATVAGYPMAYTQFLNALDFMLGPSQEIVVAGAPEQKATQEMIAVIHRAFLPNKVLLLRSQDERSQGIIALSPFLKEMVSVNQEPTVYLCEGFACRTPITDLETLSRILEGKLSAE